MGNQVRKAVSIWNALPMKMSAGTFLAIRLLLPTGILHPSGFYYFERDGVSFTEKLLIPWLRWIEFLSSNFL
jgi:hypothetical protein